MTRSKNKKRSKWLSVEFLETRRLLSAAPNRPAFDGFVRAGSFDTSRNQQPKRESGFVREETRKNSLGKESRKDKKDAKEHQKSKSRSTSISERSQVHRNLVQARTNSQRENTFVTRIAEISVSAQTPQLTRSLELPPPPQRLQPLDNVEAILPQRPVRQARNLLPSVAPDNLVQPEPTVSSLPAQATVAAKVLDTSVSNAPVVETSQVVEEIAPPTVALFDRGTVDVSSMMLPDFMVWMMNESFETRDGEPFLQLAVSDSLVLGGDVDLHQMPKLIDTLPAINADDLWLNESSEEPSDTNSNEKETEEDASSEELVEASTTPSDESAVQDTTDFVFADEQFAAETEEFGGLVEMPEELPLDCEESGVISFDKIAPMAHQIDQIIARSPEFGEEDEQEASKEHEPITINLRASLPAALLLAPSLLAKTRKRTMKLALAQKSLGRKLLVDC